MLRLRIWIRRGPSDAGENRRGDRRRHYGAWDRACRGMRDPTPHNAGADHRDGFHLHHWGPALSRSAIAALIAPPAVRNDSARRLRSSVFIAGIEMQMRRKVVVMSST